MHANCQLHAAGRASNANGTFNFYTAVFERYL